MLYKGCYIGYLKDGYQSLGIQPNSADIVLKWCAYEIMVDSDTLTITITVIIDNYHYFNYRLYLKLIKLHLQSAIICLQINPIGSGVKLLAS